MSRLESHGYKKIDAKHYYHPYENVEIIYDGKFVSVNEMIFNLDFLQSIVNARPKSYAGRKPKIIPKRFRQMCSSGMTYEQLMKEFNVSRRTIAKWKKAVK